MPEEIQWREARLHSARNLTPDIRLLEIAPSGEFVVPTPGSHINVTVQVGERRDVRSYSIVGPCTDGLYRIAVKLLPDSRGGSAYMWSLAPGAHLTISNPHNNFVLSPGRPDYILVAGGIGITPIFTLALALLQAGARFRVLYACRRHADLALADELKERIGARLELFVSEEGRRIDLAAQIAKLAPGGELYVCGPIGMLEAAKRDWRQSGRPVDQLRFETFGNSGLFASEPSSFCPRLRGAKIAASNCRRMFRAKPPERSSISYFASACSKRLGPVARARSGDAMTKAERSPSASRTLASQPSVLRTRWWLRRRRTTVVLLPLAK
jgi:vanillate monooxygenase ferredoxin subunit